MLALKINQQAWNLIHRKMMNLHNRYIYTFFFMQQLEITLMCTLVLNLISQE